MSFQENWISTIVGLVYFPHVIFELQISVIIGSINMNNRHLKFLKQRKLFINYDAIVVEDSNVALAVSAFRLIVIDNVVEVLVEDGLLIRHWMVLSQKLVDPFDLTIVETKYFLGLKRILQNLHLVVTSKGIFDRMIVFGVVFSKLYHPNIPLINIIHDADCFRFINDFVWELDIVILFLSHDVVFDNPVVHFYATFHNFSLFVANLHRFIRNVFEKIVATIGVLGENYRFLGTYDSYFTMNIKFLFSRF